MQIVPECSIYYYSGAAGLDNYFSIKNKTPYFLKSFLVYKFVCARRNSCYIGKTCRRLKTGIDKHVKKDKKYNINRHLHNNEEKKSNRNKNLHNNEE